MWTCPLNHIVERTLKPRRLLFVFFFCSQSKQQNLWSRNLLSGKKKKWYQTTSDFTFCPVRLDFPSLWHTWDNYLLRLVVCIFRNILRFLLSIFSKQPQYEKQSYQTGGKEREKNGSRFHEILGEKIKKKRITAGSESLSSRSEDEEAQGVEVSICANDLRRKEFLPSSMNLYY